MGSGAGVGPGKGCQQAHNLPHLLAGIAQPPFPGPRAAVGRASLRPQLAPELAQNLPPELAAAMQQPV